MTQPLSEVRASDSNAIFGTVQALIADILDVSVDRVRADSVLVELGAQSFDFLVLVSQLEKTYGIEVPRVYAIPDAHTVDTFVAAVEAELSASNGSREGADGTG